MTKKGYTHVLIPKILHSVLKENAKNSKTSIWKYINDLIRRDSQARYGAGLLTLCSQKELGGSSPPLVANSYALHGGFPDSEQYGLYSHQPNKDKKVSAHQYHTKNKQRKIRV